MVLSSADSLVLVLTESVGKKTGWVLQARYIIRLQRCPHLHILVKKTTLPEDLKKKKLFVLINFQLVIIK